MTITYDPEEIYRDGLETVLFLSKALTVIIKFVFNSPNKLKTTYGMCLERYKPGKFAYFLMTLLVKWLYIS